MLILLALALVLIFSVLLTAIIRPPARSGAVLSVYLLSYANIVLVGEITNFFYQLSNPWCWLELHLSLAVIAGFSWWRKGRPSLRAPFAGADGRIVPASLRDMFKCWPELCVLGIGVALSFLFSAVLLWVTAPNNNDSLATHMARIGFWLQHGSFYPWPTDRVWQLVYPVNMQLQMFWTVLFAGTDRIVESVQWVGAVAALFAVYGLARLLGAARAQAVFAALLLATLPEIILQSTTTQNDLVAGTLFAAAFYLLFLGLYQGHNRSRGMQTPHKGALALSGLAFALLVGTKQSFLILIVGLALVFAMLLWFSGQVALRGLAVWAASTLVAFILIAADMFVINQVNFGHPMGPETAIGGQLGGQTSQSLRENLAYNPLRLLYQAVDLTGLPDPLCGYGIKAKALTVQRISDAIHFSLEAPVALAVTHQFSLRTRYVVQEDAGWYGPLFAFLVLPALLYQFVKGLRMWDALRVGIFLIALIFLLVDGATRPGWDPFQGRYFIPVVMIATPLAAFLVRPGRWMAAARWAMVATALIVMVNTYLQNSGKPIGGDQSVFVTDRIAQETQQSFYMRRPARLVERKVPADATLGLLMYAGYLEYPFFRENFSRRLVNIYPPSRAEDVAWLKAQRIDYVVMQGSSETLHLPPDLRAIANEGDWTIFTWVSGR